jgi:hypothetical protein
VGAGFQRDIEGGVRQQCLLFYGGNGIHFSVSLAILPVISFSDDPVMVYNHSAYHGIWARKSFPFSGKLKTTLHKYRI